MNISSVLILWCRESTSKVIPTRHEADQTHVNDHNILPCYFTKEIVLDIIWYQYQLIVHLGRMVNNERLFW